jgi:hypothetical protein
LKLEATSTYHFNGICSIFERPICQLLVTPHVIRSTYITHVDAENSAVHGDWSHVLVVFALRKIQPMIGCNSRGHSWYNRWRVCGFLFSVGHLLERRRRFCKQNVRTSLRTKGLSWSQFNCERVRRKPVLCMWWVGVNLEKSSAVCSLKGDSDWAHCETECHAHFASSEPHANATTTWGRDFDPFPRKKLFTMLAKSKVEAVLQMWRDGSFSFTLTRCKRVNNIQQSTHFPSELMPRNWEEGSLEKGSLSSRA